jgi:hypothetical protein
MANLKDPIDYRQFANSGGLERGFQNYLNMIPEHLNKVNSMERV